VAYLADGVHIATAKQWDTIITVLNHNSGTPQQLINTGMQIQDIKDINNTIFVVDTHKLASWKLEAGGIQYTTCGVRRMAISKLLASASDPRYLVLSHDCSQVAFVDGTKVFIYNVETEEILKSIEWSLGFAEGQFSPNGHQLWLTMPRVFTGGWKILKFDLSGDWAAMEDLSKYNDTHGGQWAHDTVDSQAWPGNHPPHRYHIRVGTQWVTDSRGGKLLWLPPNWRINNEWDIRWDANLLTLLHCNHPLPIIIEFQPQSPTPHPNSIHGSDAYPTSSLAITT